MATYLCISKWLQLSNRAECINADGVSVEFNSAMCRMLSSCPRLASLLYPYPLVVPCNRFYHTTAVNAFPLCHAGVSYKVSVKTGSAKDAGTATPVSTSMSYRKASWGYCWSLDIVQEHMMNKRNGGTPSIFVHPALLI